MYTHHVLVEHQAVLVEQLFKTAELWSRCGHTLDVHRHILVQVGPNLFQKRLLHSAGVGKEKGRGQWMQCATIRTGKREGPPCNGRGFTPHLDVSMVLRNASKNLDTRFFSLDSSTPLSVSSSTSTHQTNQ